MIPPTLSMPRKKAKSSLIKKILRFLTGRRRLAPWELKAIAAAEAKRSRRRERNIRWWSNDRTWEFYHAQ